MIAVIDSGSTKADWVINSSSGAAKLTTAGMNPNFTDEETIVKILQKEVNSISTAEVKRVLFFGAGCSGDQKKLIVSNAFERVFTKADIKVETDMMGAVLATCGNDPGIVCILGTGSNSVYFDGKEIRPNNYGLGFILADEAAGSDLGKILLTNYFYGLLPEHLSFDFRQKYNLSRDEAIRKVYSNPQANAWLASFSNFYEEYKNDEWINKVLRDRFDEFFRIYIMQYPEHKKNPVHFVGSIAFLNSDLINRIATEKNIKIGKIIRKPIDLLNEFLLKNISSF